MSGLTEISSREACPVKIGSLVLYCEEFRVLGNKIFAEKSTVNGTDVFTNSACRGLKITLKGRIYNRDMPMDAVHVWDAFMRAGTEISVDYGGLTFRKCSVQSFSAEDKGEDFIHGSVTFISLLSPLRRVDSGS